MTAPDARVLVVEIDRPNGGFWDAQYLDGPGFDRILLSMMTTETMEGTVLRARVYCNGRPVETLVHARHDRERWCFEGTASDE